MIDGRSVLVLIPARGGSKGLPGKNVADLGGRPLVAWSVAAARGSAYVDDCVLSSDDDAIIAAAVAAGCEVPFRRPAELAADETGALAVVAHAVEQLRSAGRSYDYVVLLQPTSPLRTAADVDAALELCVRSGAPACVSVCRVDKAPEWMFRLDNRDLLRPVLGEEPRALRRQDLPPTVALNGAVYVGRTEQVLDHGGFLLAGTVAYQMPKSRSVDIDDELDLALCRLLIQER